MKIGSSGPHNRQKLSSFKIRAVEVTAMIFLVFFISSCSGTDTPKNPFPAGNTSANTGGKELKLKSEKNPLAEDFKITSQDITFKDLSNSPADGNWLLYNGDYGARHYSPLDQIDRNSVKNLTQNWVYKISDVNFLRSSPVEYEGVIYVTAPNEIHALDALTGKWLWIWRAYEKKNSFINRGVAIYRDQLFFITTDCRLVALNRRSGDVVWSNQYADPDLGYFSTMAPLVLEDRVIVGISNGNTGGRGFVTALSLNEGKELWRFWTLPEGFRGAPTWLTGSYDPHSDTVYWAVGRLTDDVKADALTLSQKDLYHDSILALDPKNGSLRWSTRLSSFMPFPWDSNTPLVLADVSIKGRTKNLILQANRNGLFYGIDRAGGSMYIAEQFIDKLNWDERDVICPSLWGATNWMPPSLSPVTNLMYVMVHQGCANGPNHNFIKAIEIDSGFIKWSYPVRETDLSAPGILATAGNLVFSGEGSGQVVALDAVNGKRLWEFNTGKSIFASPITYKIGGKQHLSIVAGSYLYTFGLKH